MLLIAFSTLVAISHVWATEPPGRVTGGGTLQPNTTDQSCIEVNTTIVPTVTNGLVIDHISHSGSVGAPASGLSCGAPLDNGCITGRLQHTRHYQGQSRKQEVFSSVGVFDSLLWACLGCCSPTDGVFIPPVKVGDLCNPDPGAACGPEPSPAQASAIIFSGIGKLKSGIAGTTTQYVIYRAYIEDRGEPGGFSPEGAIEPADIYCFQAWRTELPVVKKPDFSNVAVTFRTALGQANCEFMFALEAGSLPIGSLPNPTVFGLTADFQDCGPLYDGNEQLLLSDEEVCTP
jgi:hypothetical protein